MSCVITGLWKLLSSSVGLCDWRCPWFDQNITGFFCLNNCIFSCSSSDILDCYGWPTVSIFFSSFLSFLPFLFVIVNPCNVSNYSTGISQSRFYHGTKELSNCLLAVSVQLVLLMGCGQLASYGISCNFMLVIVSWHLAILHLFVCQIPVFSRGFSLLRAFS